MRDAEIRLFNSLKIIQRRLFTASLFNFFNHRKEQTGKVSMFYFSHLGKVFVLIRFGYVIPFFVLPSSCYIHAQFQVAGFKIIEIHHVTFLYFACLFLLGHLRPVTLWFPALR